jgi:hypothetical protein
VRSQNFFPKKRLPGGAFKTALEEAFRPILLVLEWWLNFEDEDEPKSLQKNAQSGSLCHCA